MKSGEGITGAEISGKGDYAVYGGNGIRGYTNAFTHEGDHILIGRQGALCGNVHFASGQFWASEHAVVVSLIPPQNLRWFRAKLSAMNLNQYSIAAAQPGLSVERVLNIFTAVPPLTEQLAIARFLDHFDHRIQCYIRAKQKLIRLLDEQNQAIINRAVTRGLDPNVRTKSTDVEWLGEVPKHWEIRRLKSISRMKSGESITASAISDIGDYAVFGGNGVRGYTSNFTHDGDYNLIGRQGALCGNVHFASGRFWASEHAVVVTIVPPLCARWFGALLTTMNLNQYSLAAAQPGLSVERLLNLKAPVPPIYEQQAIARHLISATSDLELAIAQTRTEISLVRELRTRLISDVITGKLDVRAAAKELPEEFDSRYVLNDSDALSSNEDGDFSESDLDTTREDSEE